MTAKKLTQAERRAQALHTLTHGEENGKTTTLSKVELLNSVQELLTEVSAYISSKQLECFLIEMLQRTEGYFHDEFTAEEFERMAYNIRSDFPIFLETNIGDLQQKVSDLNNECRGHLAAIDTRNIRIKDVEAHLKRENDRLRDILHILLSQEVSEEGRINTCLFNMYESHEVIMEKLNQGIALTAEELKIVRSKITNY